MRSCVDKNCKEINPQPLSNFHKSTQNKDGIKHECKKCRSRYVKEYRAKNLHKMRQQSKESNARHPIRKLNAMYKSYGITLDIYNKMVHDQLGKCLLCNKKPKQKLCVDHDHENGRIRGLLCRSCNGALGVIGDRVERLERVKKYLLGENVNE